MIKHLTLAILGMSAWMLMTSCNKKFKEDLEDLEKTVNEQKAQNENLEGDVNSLSNLMLSTPVSFSLSSNTGSAAVSVSDTYSFCYGSAHSCSYAKNNEDGTYTIYIWRGNDLGTENYLSMLFDYNPSTGVKTNVIARVNRYLSDGELFKGYFDGNNGDVTTNIQVTAFNFDAGTIAYTFSMSSNANYVDNHFSGQGMSFSSSYTGNLSKRLGGKKLRGTN
ncbi:MAG: hypothetical protein MUF42_07960 [Cytophagaceae bacterium]|jgi:hypothetical protein|nr:hypothetical protein [Cytophagaceae bacterium]